MNTDDPWLRKVLDDGTVIVDITRTTDGHVMCQICMVYTPMEDLHRGPDGQPHDVCGPCQWKEDGLPQAICPCACCVRYGYWMRHGRTGYTMAQACNCATYVDRAWACDCLRCIEQAPPRKRRGRPPKEHPSIEKAEELRGEYNAPDQPSVAQLGKRHDMSPSAVHRLLRLAGTPMRTKGFPLRET